jgi:hypothetical protein
MAKLMKFVYLMIYFLSLALVATIILDGKPFFILLKCFFFDKLILLKCCYLLLTYISWN